MSNNAPAQLDLNGFFVEWKAPEAVASFEPFRHFRAQYCGPGRVADARIEIEHRCPDYSSFPPLKMAFATPRNVVYRNGASRIIDYSGNGVILHEEGSASYRIISEDADLIREMCHLTVLSLWGQHCDRKGWLRIHAAAVSFRNAAAVIMMPAGGGKSTILRTLLKDPAFRFLSEDIAVIDGENRLHPFHSPLGLNARNHGEDFPESLLWTEKRTEFGDKLRVDIDALEDRLENRLFENLFFFAGVRLLNGEPEIRKLPAHEALRHALRDIVLGIGVYQGMEYLFSHSSAETLSRFPVLFRRLVHTLKLLRKFPFYEIRLSGDSGRNASVLKAFLAGRT